MQNSDVCGSGFRHTWVRLFSKCPHRFCDSHCAMYMFGNHFNHSINLLKSALLKSWLCKMCSFSFWTSFILLRCQREIFQWGIIRKVHLADAVTYSKDIFLCGPSPSHVQSHLTWRLCRYVTYRLLLSMASIPMFSAFRAAMADLTDRTTEECVSMVLCAASVCAYLYICSWMATSAWSEVENLNPLATAMDRIEHSNHCWHSASGSSWGGLRYGIVWSPRHTLWWYR